jgi:hypothetical protein
MLCVVPADLKALGRRGIDKHGWWFGRSLGSSEIGSTIGFVLEATPRRGERSILSEAGFLHCVSAREFRFLCARSGDLLWGLQKSPRVAPIHLRPRRPRAKHPDRVRKSTARRRRPCTRSPSYLYIIRRLSLPPREDGVMPQDPLRLCRPASADERLRAGPAYYRS